MAQIHLIPVEAAVSDDELMARVQAGSSGAFAALYDRYRARSYRVSHAVCHDRGRWRTPSRKPSSRSGADGTPISQREVITLAFFANLTHTEIAAQLDLPPGTVKGRMRLGLTKLRDELERDEAA